MATVYMATDLRLERRVALKVMHGHLADDSQFKARFIQEARSAARLGHPNVVNVFDQGQDSEMAYLVMEYLPGITLRDLLDEHPVLTVEQTLDIMEAVLAGLAAAHRAGIVHRDLKPENVLLADDGRIKIGDFGLARAATANTATGATLLGTIAYLSPELLTRGIADARSDIYAMGIMMYEMLAGEQPFKGEQPMQIAYQHANDSVPKPSAKNPRVPAEVDELVLWATARDPEERPRDARTLLDQLFETHTALKSALPTAPATKAQRTMVLPAALTTQRSTAETQVLDRPQPGSEDGLEVSDNTAALVTRASQRRARGWWLAGLVITLTALAAGTGWYFGAGPGSKTTIPHSISGMTVEKATTTLENLGLTVDEKTGSIDSPTIPVGQVAQTDPAIGSQVTHGGTVRLLLSTGPRLLQIPVVKGLPEDQASTTLKNVPFTLKSSIRQFDSKVAKGLVLDALGADGKSLLGQKTYGEEQPVTLVVSAGALPDVGGKSVDEATQILAGAKLTAVAGDHVFSDFPEGKVVGIDPETNDQGVSRTFRENDTVKLLISKGPDLVEVPDVVGMSIRDAKKTLEHAGFIVQVDTGPSEFYWKFIPVSDQNPNGGEMVKRGSTVIISG